MSTNVRLSSTLALAFLALVLAASTTAYAGSISVLVGDQDNYGGLCTSDIGGPGTCNWTGSPYYDTDARDAAEIAATNGAQYTDEYDALGYGPTTATSISFLMPFSGTLASGAVTIAVADLQASSFGPLTADINGTPISLAYDDGFTADNVYSFTLTAAELAAANLAGQVTLDISRGNSGDFVGFDWVELTGTPVPEPGSCSLVLTGLAGLTAMIRRRR